jgi:hypothetical protein
VRVDDRRQSFHQLVHKGRRPRSTSSLVRRLVVVLAVGAVVDI